MNWTLIYTTIIHARYLFQQSFLLVCRTVFNLFCHSLHTFGQFIPVDLYITAWVGQLQCYYTTTQCKRSSFTQFHHNKTGHPESDWTQYDEMWTAHIITERRGLNTLVRYHPDAEPKINCLVADFLPTSLMIFSIKDFASSAVFSKSSGSDVDGTASPLSTIDGVMISFQQKHKLLVNR